MSRVRMLVLSVILIGLWPGAAAAFSMTVSWKGTAKCFDPQSPIIRLSAVPKGTKSIAFQMTDLDAPNYPHGGGTVTYAGQKSLPKGAFSYRGPCPPAPHRYRWTARARDANGKAIGTAQTTVRFSQ
jgi:phosphatidylethanolamine-binding protein (PEBP) family uncharacterized protein